MAISEWNRRTRATPRVRLSCSSTIPLTTPEAWGGYARKDLRLAFAALVRATAIAYNNTELMWHLFKEFLLFMREEKKWWLLPFIILLLLLGIVFVVAPASPLAPFIYSLF